MHQGDRRRRSDRGGRARRRTSSRFETAGRLTMDCSYRVACLVSHPIQYQAPLFRHLAARSGIELTVFFLSDLSVHAYRDSGFNVDVKWDVPLLDGYRHEFLPRVGSGSGLSFSRPLTFRLRARLRHGQLNVKPAAGFRLSSPGVAPA